MFLKFNLLLKQGNSHNSLKHSSDEKSGPLSPNSVPVPKQLKYTAGIVNGSVRESAAFTDPKRKVNILIELLLNFVIDSVVNYCSLMNKNLGMQMVPMSQLSMKKLSQLALVGHSSGKLWRWKRSHHQWLLQFKWKWQKPWRLSELIKHSDETIMRSKPRPLPAAASEIMYHRH